MPWLKYFSNIHVNHEHSYNAELIMYFNETSVNHYVVQQTIIRFKVWSV